MFRTLLVIGFVSITSSILHAEQSPATRPSSTTPKAKTIALKDIDGIERHPLDANKGKGAVIFFLAHDCPISNSYAPEINRICAAYGGAGKFTFTIVHPYGELTADEARKHAKEYGLTAPVIIDAGHVVSDYVGAKVMPQAAVVAPDGKVLYVGRIDDKWVSYGKSRVEPTVLDLRKALDSILSSKPIATARTDAVGCPI